MKMKFAISMLAITLGTATQSVAATGSSQQAAVKIQAAIASICQGQGSNEVVVDFPSQGLLSDGKLWMTVQCKNGQPIEWAIGARPNYSTHSCGSVGVRLQW